MVKKNILGFEITMMMKVKSIYEFYKNSVKEYKLNIISEIRYSTEFPSPHQGVVSHDLY